MSIRIHNFMGRFGWEMQKHFPMLSSNAYLKLQFARRAKSQKAYIDFFNAAGEVPHPLIVNIETVNRCNSDCAFCTASRANEKRPFCRMDDELFKSIIDQLADWGFKGHLTLYGNNEPWIDTAIVERHKYCREVLPDSFIFMSTNGLLLDIDKVKSIVPYVDQLIINNYCDDMKLHDNIKEIYDYVVANPDEFGDVEILIQMRYIKAVLTNRAGTAPNKAATEKVITETCLMPYTDMFIFPDGRMGLCCCDNLERTTLADLTKEPLQEAWQSVAYKEARKQIAGGRQNYPFCKHCDFIDAGLRMDAVSDVLNGRKMRGARQSMFARKNS
ncbi:MAG: SPASM domain-containing protein [Lachnospiraceae bacterium]|nr:SPASM domain-containing protein [Lachnospiraceae bacterium]